MPKRVITGILSFSVMMGVAPPALAQSSPPAQPQPATSAKPAKDPNEIVCERQQQLGSRLASEKVCKTRAEWAEERRTNRQDIEKIQMQRDLRH